MFISTMVDSLQYLAPGLLIAFGTIGIIMAAFAVVLLLPEDELSITPDQVAPGYHQEEA